MLSLVLAIFSIINVLTIDQSLGADCASEASRVHVDCRSGDGRVARFLGVLDL